MSCENRKQSAEQSMQVHNVRYNWQYVMCISPVSLIGAQMSIRVEQCTHLIHHRFHLARKTSSRNVQKTQDWMRPQVGHERRSEWHEIAVKKSETFRHSQAQVGR